MTTIPTLENLMIELIKLKNPEPDQKMESHDSLYSKKEDELHNCIDSIIENGLNSFSVIIINKFECSFCNVKRPCVKLGCLHRICTQCYLEELAKNTQGTMNQKVRVFCKNCKDVEINPERMYEICLNQKIQEIGKQNQLKAMEYTCRICNAVKNGGNTHFVELFCGHVFCLECLKPSIGIQLYNQNCLNMNFYCPICNPTFKQIDNGVILRPLFFKCFEITDYEELLQSISLLRIEKNPDYPFQTYSCSYCNKGASIFIQRGQQEVSCPSCGIKCCPKCISKQIHKGITCEQFEEEKRKKDLLNKAKEDEYQNYKKQKNIRTCPACKSDVLKVSGCDYVYCPCGNQFCNICERQLYERYHGSHFNAPGYKCKGLANLSD